jgi:epoxyqueuosine reductase
MRPKVPSAPMEHRPVTDELVHELRELADLHAIDAFGIADAEPLDRARIILEERKAAGLHAGMAFTYKNPTRSTTPSLAVRDARSIVVGARNYLLDEPPDHGSGPQARIARYAWLDHYAPLRSGLWAIARRLRADGWRAVAFVDDNSIVDREVAWRAGIGWFGKNANLLLPGRGSWFVLGCVVTDAPLPPARSQTPDGCGGCRRCLDGCPTAAIVAPGVVDANRCLAWLLQRPGTFPREFRDALGDRIYGCDDCQEVCPPNVRFGRSTVAAHAHAVASVSVGSLLECTDDELLERHGSWYLHDREPRWLRRNALIVLANTADGTDPVVERSLLRWLADPDPMLRAHAVWAAARLGRRDLLVHGDTDPEVRAELDALPPARSGPAPSVAHRAALA